MCDVARNAGLNAMACSMEVDFNTILHKAKKLFSSLLRIIRKTYQLQSKYFCKITIVILHSMIHVNTLRYSTAKAKTIQQVS